MQPVTPQTAWAPPVAPPIAPAVAEPAPHHPVDGEVQAIIAAAMRELAKQDEREAFHRSAMIDAQIEQMKIHARIEGWRTRLSVEHGGTWQR